MKTAIALLAALLMAGTALAQTKAPVIPSDAAARSRTPEQQAILDSSTAELGREMQLLGIKELRPPRNAVHPGRPDFANYDEAKANPASDEGHLPVFSTIFLLLWIGGGLQQDQGAK